MGTTTSHPSKSFLASSLTRGVIGVVGFILSPLSWWNDLVVNFPLSFGFAWIVGKCLNLFMVVHRWMFLNLFLIGYFLTNLLGFLMMHYSIFGLRGGRRHAISKQIIVSLIYAVAVVAFFGLDICAPEKGCAVLPNWVKP